jgi:hypothetical protein
MPARFDKVDDNVYRGGEPSSTDLEILANIYDIKRIVSLDENVAKRISPHVKKLNIEHILIPISGDNNKSKKYLNYLKENIVELLTDNAPTYVHCFHGKDRTGLAVGLYRMKKGCSMPEALREAMSNDFGVGVDEDTKKLYLDCFIGKKDVNNALGDSVVGQMRDHFHFGDVAPAFLTQQSLAPRMDLDKQPPSYPLSEKEMKRIMRRRRLRSMLDQDEGFESVPMVGQYDNYSGIRGVGPVENQGMLNL